MGSPEDARDERFFRQMFFVRRFEETLLALFEEGLLNGTTHACIGQEADCVGVLDHLAAEDHVFSNHRCHGHYLIRSGGDAFGLLAEIMGKPAGLCGGKGGSQHVCAPGFKSNGILGGTVPAAAGIALGFKLSRSDAVSVVFAGDGAFGEGVVYETLNLASLWKLPLLLVVENNLWSQSTPIATNLAGNIQDRIAAFGIPVETQVTTDVLEIHEAAGRAFDAVRRDRSPQALVIETYRLCHHSKSDDARPEEEVKARWATEPLSIHGARLAAADAERVRQEVEAALAEVVERARAA